MAESSYSEAPPKDASASDAEIRSSTSKEDVESCATVKYDESKFWKTVSIGICTAMDEQIVRAATRDLCLSLLLEEKPAVVMEKAAKLAAQFRDKYGKLLVNHAELQQFFAVKTDVRLDISVAEADAAKFLAECDKKWQKNLVAFIYRLTAKQCLAFGPAFACLILRLGKHPVRSVAKKICKLRCKTNTDYTTGQFQEKHMVSLLWKYAGAKPKKILANTVFGGFMYAYHKQSLDRDLRGLLDFLILQSMRYSGMALVTLCSEVVQLSLIQHSPTIYGFLNEMAKKTGWKCAAYNEVVSKYLSKDSTAVFWKYARVFDDRVFAELSYSRNRRMCNLSAHVIDLLTDENKIEEWPVLGPKYQSLVQIRPKSSNVGLSRDDVDFAKDIFDRIVFEQRRPLSSLARVIMNK